MPLLCCSLLPFTARWYYLGDAYEIAGDCRSVIRAEGTFVYTTALLGPHALATFSQRSVIMTDACHYNA
jgi:hypothetical protein